MKIEPFSTTCTTNDINSDGFKYDDSKSYDDNINDYKNTMDEYSRKNFEINRQKSYKLTYMTCIIYSVIAFSIIFVSALTDWGNNLFYNELYLFTMTFVVGSIIIISILVYKVYSFDFPDLTKKITNDAYYCPDYWISKTINPTDYNINIEEGDSVEIKKFFGNNNYSHFNIECSLSGIYNMNMLYSNKELQTYYDYKIGVVNGNENVLFIELYLSNDNKKEPLKTRSGLNQDMEYFKFCQIAATMSGYTLINGDSGYIIEKNNENALRGDYDSLLSDSKVPLICSRIYPLFMAHEDVKYANENKIYNTTKFRCAFSRLTGIPWSQIGCK
jgi:hypothetical protein